MGRSLWGNERAGAKETSDTARKAESFRQESKSADIGNQLVADIRHYLTEEGKQRDFGRDTDHLHASEICKSGWCPRASWYTITKVEPDKKGRSINPLVAREGHDIHDTIQGAIWKAGRLTGLFGCREEACGHVWWTTSPTICERCSSPFLRYLEVPVEDESIRLLGHGDGLVEGTDVGQALLEVKSVSAGTIRIEVPGLYRAFESGEMTLPQVWDAIKRPFPTHLRQINLYLRALGLRHCIVVYWCKWDQQLKGFHVRYQPHLIEDIVTGCQSVMMALDNDRVVRRPDWAEEDHKTCKSCVYRSTCWRLDDEDVRPAGAVRLFTRR